MSVQLIIFKIISCAQIKLKSKLKVLVKSFQQIIRLKIKIIYSWVWKEKKTSTKKTRLKFVVSTSRD